MFGLKFAYTILRSIVNAFMGDTKGFDTITFKKVSDNGFCLGTAIGVRFIVKRYIYHAVKITGQYVCVARFHSSGHVIYGIGWSEGQ